MASTLLGIPELIDLALGSPEIGVVNFNILHALLHIMVKEVFSSDSKVELVQSSDGKFETILHRCLRPSAELSGISTQQRLSTCDILKIKEHDGQTSTISMLATGNSSANDISPRSKAGMEPTRYQAERGIKINCDGKFLRKKINDFLEKKMEAKIANEKFETGNKTEIVVINKNTDLTMISSRETEVDMQYQSNLQQNAFNKGTVIATIEEVLPLIREQNKRDLNSKFTASVSDSDGSDHTEDNFHSKRPSGRKATTASPLSNRDRERAGMDSNSSVEVLTKKKPSDNPDNRQKSILHLGANRPIESDEVTVLDSVGNDGYHSSTDNIRRIEKIELDVKNFKILLHEHEKNFTEKLAQMDNVQKETSADRLLAELNQPSETTEVKTDDLNFLMCEMRNLQQESCKLKKEIKEVVQKIHLNVRIQDDIDEKLHFPVPTSKTQFEYFKERFTKIDETFSEVTTQLMNLEKEVCVVAQRIGDTTDNSKIRDPNNMSTLNLIDLHQELTSIKEYIETVMMEIKKVNHDNEEANQIMENIKTSIDMLASTKLDKEEIDELLSEKADYRMLQRKVSVDSFDTNRRKLEKTLLDALQRINDQERQIQSTMKTVVENVDKKLDEEALKPIQENIDRKIQTLNDKISAAGTNKQEPEGAATRSIYLRNVNCIACDQHVMMRTSENERLPKTENAFMTKSLKPHLIYNLDNLRKEIKQISTTRNLHHFETLNKLGERLEKEDARQSANRFCGGSHTKITNQRRLETGIGSNIHSPNKPKQPNSKCVCKPATI